MLTENKTSFSVRIYSRLLFKCFILLHLYFVQHVSWVRGPNLGAQSTQLFGMYVFFASTNLTSVSLCAASLISLCGAEPLLVCMVLITSRTLLNKVAP